MKGLLGLLLVLPIAAAATVFSPPVDVPITITSSTALVSVNLVYATTGAWTVGNTFYAFQKDGCTDGTIIGIVSVTATGGSFAGTLSTTGTNGASFKFVGSNLECNGTVSAGAKSFNVVATEVGATGSPLSQAVSAYLGQTHYVDVAPGSGGNGADANNGLTAGAAWLTWNHAQNCGDRIYMVARTNYAAGNFATAPTVTCSGNDNVAWLTCASTLQACKIPSGTTNCVVVAKNYIGVSGIWCDGQTNSGIKVEQIGGSGTTVAHHIAVVNNIVTNNSGSGIQTGQASGIGAGNDYEIIVGNLAYANSGANGPCFSGISLAGDSNSDTNAGIHRYLAYNISWGNLNGPTCNGTNTTDGEGIIFDRPDVNDVTQLSVFENNLLIGNGSRGFEVFANNANPGGNIPVVLRNNTMVGNILDPHLDSNPNTQIMLQGESGNIYLNINAQTNLSASYVNTSGGVPGTEAALLDSNVNASLSLIDANWLYGAAGSTHTIDNYHSGYTCLSLPNIPTPSPDPSHTACSATITGTDPIFTGAVYLTSALISGTTLTTTGNPALAVGMYLYDATNFITSGTKITGGSGNSWTVNNTQTVASSNMVALPIPGGPSCSGQSDTIGCMSTTISNFTPTASSSTNYGYGKKAACDTNNNTVWVANVMRVVPTDMQNCTY